MKAITVLILAALATAGTSAQHGGHAGRGGTATTYAGLQARDIKALSAEEIRGLIEAEGMRMALAAELNGHPGHQRLRGYTVTSRP